MEKSLEIVQTYYGNFVIDEYDLVGRFIKHQKKWEYHLYEFYSKILNENDYCIDAGANLGFHTIQFGNLSKKVYAFEPQSYIYNQLCANILFNGLDDKIIPFKQALGDKEDTQQLWNIEHEGWVGQGIHNWGGRGIIQDNYGGDRAVNNEHREHDVVNIITLDSLNIPQCDLIKMDIQGYEYHALLGAKKLLDKFKPVILLENPSQTEECDVKAKQFLLDMGYEVYRYCGASNKEDCIFIHPDSKKYVDALLIIDNIKTKYNILQEK